MNRRQFMLVLGAGGAMIALTACDGMPASAVAPWKGPASTETDPRLRALSWAMLAPNPHNLQSWVADVREPGMVKLHVDVQRLLPQTDPANRQILIGCGAFLELMCMAAAQDGWRATVEVMPEGDYGETGVDQRPFALVRFARDLMVKADPLFEGVRTRRTNRRPYETKVPDLKVLQSLHASADRPEIFFSASTSPGQVKRISDIAIEGYRIEFTTLATWMESAALMRVGAEAVAAEPSGLAILGTEVWFGRKLGMLTPDELRKIDGIAARRAVEDSIKAAHATYAWIWLTSATNSRRAQIEAGRAYMRIDLAAAMMGLAIHPNSQALQEFPQMQSLFHALHQVVGVAQPARVQMLARIGYANRAEPAPRRPLARIVRS